MTVSSKMDDQLNHPRLSNDIATVLSAPWLINRVTCGTMVTWSQANPDSQDVVVSLDICLLGLITANVFLFGPLLLRRAGLSQELDGVVGGVGGVVGGLQERLDLLPAPPPLPWERWTGDGGDEEEDGGFGDNGGGGSGSNATFLEGAVATFLNSVPLQTSLKLANQLSQIFERSGDTSKEEEEGKDEEFGSDEDENLNIQRLPVFVYKFPVGKHSSFGDGYEGMETEVGEILDLSLATDPERTTYLRLPRKEVVGASSTGGTLPKLRDALGHLMREVLGEEMMDEVVELLVATFGRALTFEKSAPRNLFAADLVKY